MDYVATCTALAAVFTACIKVALHVLEYALLAAQTVAEEIELAGGEWNEAARYACWRRIQKSAERIEFPVGSAVAGARFKKECVCVSRALRC
jgi:hypothetical protein